MATGEVRHVAASRGADGVASAMRLGRDGSVITRDFVMQLALEGKLFIAGVGLEGTALTGLTTLAETTPSIWLGSPSGDNVAIMPLYFEALVSAEGGAAPDWYISLVTANIGITTAGTVVVPQSIGVVGATSSAILQTGPTTAAWTSLQNVMLANSQNALDNLISVEHATGANTDKDDYMNALTKISWRPMAPIVMRGGQAWAFHTATGVTGTDYEWTLLFAEFSVAAHV